jgi:hypothetical protein
MFGSYIMFHWVQGIPFEFNNGAYDHLNMWEQIDNGDQYTPAKKFLLMVPIVLSVLFVFLLGNQSLTAQQLPRKHTLHPLRPHLLYDQLPGRIGRRNPQAPLGSFPLLPAVSLIR